MYKLYNIIDLVSFMFTISPATTKIKVSKGKLFLWYSLFIMGNFTYIHLLIDF